MKLRNLTNDELARELIHARNRRDAYAEGREPTSVLLAVRRLLTEQSRRRAARKQATR